MRRPFAVLSAGAVSIAVVGGVVLALWGMGSSAAERQPFSTLAITPRDVDFYVAVNTEPASPQWIAFADLLDTIAVEDPLRDLWSDLLSEQDLAWDKDIVALLGDEAYIAVTDWSALDDQRGAVAVAQLRNEGRAKSLFLERVSEALVGEDEELEQTSYEGETIYLLPLDGESADWDESYTVDEDGTITIDVADDDVTGTLEDDFEDDEFGGGGFSVDSDPAAVAFVDGLVILGISEEDVRGVIDVVQGRAPSALDNERFVELQSLQTQDFLMWGYIDVADGIDAIEEFIEENIDEEEEDAEEFADALEQARDASDRVTFVVSAASDHFVIDVQTLYPDGQAPENAAFISTPFDSTFAAQVPEDSVFFAAGQDPYNGIYRPIIDAFEDTEINTGSAYCSDFGAFPFAPVPVPGLGRGSSSDEEDPVYGQFYDENGNFDSEAFFEWSENIDRIFTRPDGSYDYEGYSDYIDSLYEEACAGSKKTVAQIIAEFEEDAGFRLDEDLLSLMTGEVALSLHVDDLSGDDAEFRVLGLAEVLDAARVEASLELLEQYLAREEDGVEILGADGEGVHRLSVESSDEDFDDDTETYEVAWASKDGVLTMGYPYDAVADFVSGTNGASLADSGDWRRTMELLPPAKTFVAYVNIAGILERVAEMEDAAEEFSEATDGKLTLDDLRPLRSVGIATTNIDGGSATRIVVFVNE